MTRALLAASVAAVTLTAVACTSSGGPTASSPPATPTSSVVTPSAPPVSDSPTPTPTTPTPTPTPTPTTPTTPTPTPTRRPACTAAQLTVSAVRGGAFQGREIAGIVFTNSSSGTCTMRGYPFAQLRHKGKPLGRRATKNPGTVRTVVLKPGASAQTQLTAVTTCQSVISDHARVRAPRTTASTDVAVQLRSCSLSIDPLQAG